MERDVSIAMMGSAMAAAGLLLIFSGFLFTRADQLEPRRGAKYRCTARLGLIPLVTSLICTWLSLKAAEGGAWSASHLGFAFRSVLVLTALYAMLALLLAK